MNVILKGNGEKIICIQQKEQKVIYNGENTLIDNRMPISLSSVNTKTIELFYCICKFPLRLIVVIFDIIFMNYEWDWIDNFEPCIFQVDNYICEACKTLEIEYNKSKYDKENRKIVLPQIIINGKEIKIESFLYLENLKLCFLKCCLKMVGMLIWCLIPLIIITINAGKYSIYIWIIDCCIIFALIVKISLEYHKFCNIKRQLNLQKKNKNGFVNY